MEATRLRQSVVLLLYGMTLGGFTLFLTPFASGPTWLFAGGVFVVLIIEMAFFPPSTARRLIVGYTYFVLLALFFVVCVVGGAFYFYPIRILDNSWLVFLIYWLLASAGHFLISNRFE